MTLIYGSSYYHLSADAVTAGPAGEPPQPVDPSALPLPVARVLAAWKSREN